MALAHHTGPALALIQPTLLVAVLSLTLCVAVPAAGDTNILYLPLDTKAPFGEGAKIRSQADREKLARALPECRPAELDPDGHWGEITQGLQASIRYTTNVLLKTKPFPVTVILRNTTTNTIIIPGPADWFLSVSLTDSNHTVIPPAAPHRADYSGGASTVLPPRTQASYNYDLASAFDIRSPGQYSIQASFDPPPASNLKPVRSAPAPVAAMPPPKP